jgi:hypothetical protein
MKEHLVPVTILGFAAILALTAGCGYGMIEPSDQQLRETFERHRRTVDELRQMFRDDAVRKLFIVSASGLGGTRCSDELTGTSCLSAERWHEYGQRLRSAGILEMRGYEGIRGGLYFEVYRGPWENSARRSRGLVYDRGVSKITYPHDDVEDRVDLGDGWFSYLYVDN